MGFGSFLVLVPPIGTLAGCHLRGNKSDARLCTMVNDADDFVARNMNPGHEEIRPISGPIPTTFEHGLT
jgi:hypothetical protein